MSTAEINKYISGLIDYLAVGFQEHGATWHSRHAKIINEIKAFTKLLQK